MEIVKVIWWKHRSPSGQYSSGNVHGSLRELLEKNKDGTYNSNILKEKLKNLEVQELDQIEGEELQKLCK
jgi:CRISPR-associated protein Csd2